MGQPLVLDQFLADEMVLEQGLLSRTLVTMPNSTVGNRFWRQASASAVDASNGFADRIYHLLQLPLPLAEGKQNELAPPCLDLAPSTAQKWIHFHDCVEAQVGPGRVLDPVRGLALKAPEIAARLAGMLALFEDPSCGLVTQTHLEGAIDIIDYYLLEALRLFGRAPERPSIRRAVKLWNFLQAKRYKLISLADICQVGPNELRERDLALAALNLLEKHNYVRRLSGGAEINGLHRRQAWLVWESPNGEL
jgi:hypothetical protein